VRALVGLLDEPAAEGDVFNIGSSEEISIAELAQLVRARTSSSSDIVYTPYDVAYETGFEDMARRVPETGKIRGLIGWEPRRRLVEILDDVAGEVVAEGAPVVALPEK
jgi:UDP-glucose 4-epimerase